jgi:hypothetical protein
MESMGAYIAILIIVGLLLIIIAAVASGEKKEAEKQAQFLVIDKITRIETTGFSYYGAGNVKSNQNYYLICQNCETQEIKEFPVTVDTFYKTEINDTISFQ